MTKRRAGYKTYLCTDEEPLSMWEVPYPECPNAAAHTKNPRGYLAWHAWAESMGETNVQERCEGCGMYVIWKPKP